MRLFIYGTLKRGDCRHDFLIGQTFLGAVCTRPIYRLYNLGTYPGLVRAVDGVSIEGELWEIDERCLRTLDGVEGVGDKLYSREPVELASPHDDVQAETYLYQRSVAGCTDCGTRW